MCLVCLNTENVSKPKGHLSRLLTFTNTLEIPANMEVILQISGALCPRFPVPIVYGTASEIYKSTECKIVRFR
jgi:hypothetical protein